jgi:dihydropteroate synthase
VKDTTFSANFSVNFKGNLRVYKQPVVMGIINTTPDSFYANSRQTTIDNAIVTGRNMIKEGAEILDIGGYSSRPGAEDISINTEIQRVIPVIKAIKSEFPTQLLSIDTFRTDVAHAAIEAGADMINDISGGANNESIYQLAADYKTPYVLMHMKGTPQNMQSNTQYSVLTSDIIHYFSKQLNVAKNYGLADIIIDVGIGFSKTLSQNFSILKNLCDFNIFDKPQLLGISRKSLIYKTLNSTPDQALNGTNVLHTIGLVNGAKILRVHDVQAATETIKLYQQLA